MLCVLRLQLERRQQPPVSRPGAVEQLEGEGNDKT